MPLLKVQPNCDAALSLSQCIKLTAKRRDSSLSALSSCWHPWIFSQIIHTPPFLLTKLFCIIFPLRNCSAAK